MTERKKRKKRWKHPLNLKTGRCVFTPVLRSTGKRLNLEVDYSTFPKIKTLGYHGTVQDVKSGKWYAVFGKECDLPGCKCDAWVVEVDSMLPSGKLPEWCNVYEGMDDNAIARIEKVILRRAAMTRFVRPILRELAQTCQFVPAQWEGKTVDDRPVYIRGRHGILSARIGPAAGSLHDAIQGEELTCIPREDADFIESEQLESILPDALDFSQLKTIENRCED